MKKKMNMAMVKTHICSQCGAKFGKAIEMHKHTKDYHTLPSMGMFKK